MTLFDLPLTVSWPAFVTLAVLAVAWLMFWRDFKLTPSNIIAFLAITGAFAKIVLDLTLWDENPGVITLHVTRFWVGVGFAALLLTLTILFSARVYITREKKKEKQETDN